MLLLISSSKRKSYLGLQSWLALEVFKANIMEIIFDSHLKWKEAPSQQLYPPREKPSPWFFLLVCLLQFTAHRMFKCRLFHSIHTIINLIKMKHAKCHKHASKDSRIKISSQSRLYDIILLWSVFELPKNIRQLESILGSGNKDKVYKRLSNVIKKEWESYITMSWFFMWHRKIDSVNTGEPENELLVPCSVSLARLLRSWHFSKFWDAFKDTVPTEELEFWKTGFSLICLVNLVPRYPLNNLAFSRHNDYVAQLPRK